MFPTGPAAQTAHTPLPPNKLLILPPINEPDLTNQLTISKAGAQTFLYHVSHTITYNAGQPASAPRTGKQNIKKLKKWLAQCFLKLGGWKVEGERPEHKRFVLIAAPHTSNWDFPLMLAYAALYELKISWMGKHGLFKPPLGWFMRAMGGIPVVRNKNQNTVSAMADAFSQQDDLILVVPAEGTRARAEYWKSGFYQIALQAEVPIVPSFLDFGKKRGGFGPALVPTGNIGLDMQWLRDFYAPMKGKFPEKFGPIRLREENDGAD